MSKILVYLLLASLLSLALAEDVLFKYVPPTSLEVSSVSLRGDFNNWAESPMELQNDGSWTVTISLEPGEYQYKFYINKQWPANMENWQDLGPVDPTADGYMNDGYDGQNAIRVVKGPVLAEGEVASFNINQVKFNPNELRFLSIAKDNLIIRLEAKLDTIQKINIVVDNKEYLMYKQLWWRTKEVWRVRLEPNAINYHFTITSTAGDEVILDDNGTDFSFDGKNVFANLDWVSNQNFYQIFPDRFFNGNPYNDYLALQSDEWVFNKAGSSYGGEPILSAWNDPPGPSHCCHQYFGGDIAGIIKKLDYLQSIGMTAIYLNPIFDSGSAHGYDTHDYLKISPKFGTKESFRMLLDLAHAKNIKVILDFVPNHTGLGFWAFQDIIKNGQESPYWNWYTINKWPFKAGETDAYLYWASAPSLPKLNMLNPETKAYMLDLAKYWIDFGIDGWRVDVPNELSDAHHFFKDMRKIVKDSKPDAYLIGEIWQTAPEWLQGDEFDSLMNYSLGKDLILRYARDGANGFSNAKRTLANMSKYYASYGENVVGMGFNLMSSHDTARALSELGGGNWGQTPNQESIERLKLAFSLLYTLPGAPVTFQGDECGILGQKKALGTQDLHRYPIQWENCNPDLQAHYKKLADLRANYPALSTAVLRAFDSGNNVLGYYRGEPEQRGELLILANGTNEELSVVVPKGNWRRLEHAGILRTGKELKLSALEFAVLIRLKN